MKRIKQYTALLLTVILVICSFTKTESYVCAYNSKEHNSIMRQVLFKDRNSKLADSSSDNEDVSDLERACYLTIDQYNGNGAEELAALKLHGVKGLPANISVIDYKDGPYHRRKTHCGWNYEYINDEDQQRWITRKQILINTVDKIFDFEGNESQKDSFCAILYYTHILGDRIADDKYYPNYVIMEVGGRKDKQDICNELLNHIEILFSDQKGTHKYTRIRSKINGYNSRIAKLSLSSISQLTDEQFDEYKECSEGVLKTLTLYVPAMLKEESFFANVFYSG